MESGAETPGTGPMRPRVRVSTVVVVGLLAGLLSGMFGVGGGILVVPGLVLLARMDQRFAHGTSLAAVLPIAVSSLATYWAHDHVDWPVAFWLSLGAVVGAVVGTKLLHVLPHRWLAIGFSVMLVAAAVRLFMQTTGTGRGDLDATMFMVLVVVGLVTGILAGLLGVGGGIVMVPVMMMILSLTPVIAKGTSVAVIIPTALMGTWRNRSADNVDLRAAGIVGGCGILTAIVGGWISARMSDTVSNVLFAVLLVVVALRLVLQVRAEGRIVHSGPPLIE